MRVPPPWPKCLPMPHLLTTVNWVFWISIYEFGGDTNIQIIAHPNLCFWPQTALQTLNSKCIIDSWMCIRHLKFNKSVSEPALFPVFPVSVNGSIQLLNQNHLDSSIPQKILSALSSKYIFSHHLHCYHLIQFTIFFHNGLLHTCIPYSLFSR